MRWSKRKQPIGPPMTLADMRALGVRALTCRVLLGVTLAATISWPASGDPLLTYAEWELLPERLRTLYMSSAFNILIYWSPNQNTRKSHHYYKCVSDARMTSSQLAQNVKDYASGRPELGRSVADRVLLQYLSTLCGPIPD